MRRSSYGFSLIELVVVLAVAAILVGVAAPRFFDRTVFAERGYADELAESVRQAQRTATLTGCAVEIRINARGFRARMPQSINGHCAPLAASNWSTPLRRSDGGELDSVPPAGVRIRGNTRMVFGADGRASNPSAVIVPIGVRRLRVEAQTGRTSVL